MTERGDRVGLLDAVRPQHVALDDQQHVLVRRLDAKRERVRADSQLPPPRRADVDVRVPLPRPLAPRTGGPQVGRDEVALPPVGTPRMVEGPWSLDSGVEVFKLEDC